MSMTRKLGWICAVAFTATAIAALATAASKQSLNVVLLHKSTWNGQELAAGSYKISWQGEPAALKVTILRGGRVVAAGQGRLEERTTRATSNAVIWQQDASGALRLTAVQFANKNTVLVLAAS